MPPWFALSGTGASTGGSMSAVVTPEGAPTLR
jgi:hypothetical protein